jgi:cell wall assembly regulator SMI1
MSDVIEKCNVLLDQLYLFSRDVIYLGESILDNRLEIFEDEIGFELPSDFKYIMKRHNGISLFGTEIIGIDESRKDGSLEAVYKFEHSTSPHKMPKEFLPFSPDGRGNHYCLNLAKIKNGTSPVVFWQWDYNYGSVDEVEEANKSLLAWIKEVMIDWKLEEYNYDGTEK